MGSRLKRCSSLPREARGHLLWSVGERATSAQGSRGSARLGRLCVKPLKPAVLDGDRAGKRSRRKEQGPSLLQQGNIDISVSGETDGGRRRSSDQAGEWQIDEAKRHKPSNATQRAAESGLIKHSHPTQRMTRSGRYFTWGSRFRSSEHPAAPHHQTSNLPPVGFSGSRRCIGIHTHRR